MMQSQSPSKSAAKQCLESLAAVHVCHDSIGTFLATLDDELNAWFRARTDLSGRKTRAMIAAEGLVLECWPHVMSPRRAANPNKQVKAGKSRCNFAKIGKAGFAISFWKGGRRLTHSAAQASPGSWMVPQAPQGKPCKCFLGSPVDCSGYELVILSSFYLSPFTNSRIRFDRVAPRRRRPQQIRLTPDDACDANLDSQRPISEHQFARWTHGSR